MGKRDMGAVLPKDSVAHQFTAEEWDWLCARKHFDSLIDRVSTRRGAKLAILAGKAMLPVDCHKDRRAHAQF